MEVAAQPDSVATGLLTPVHRLLAHARDKTITRETATLRGGRKTPSPLLPECVRDPHAPWLPSTCCPMGSTCTNRVCAASAFFRGHGRKMCEDLLDLCALTLGTLGLVRIVFLDAQVHLESPVTCTTGVIIGWHIRLLGFRIASCLMPLRALDACAGGSRYAEGTRLFPTSRWEMALLHNACGIPSVRNVRRAGSPLPYPCAHGSSNGLGCMIGGAS